MSKQKDKNSMSFLEHLGELRWHLMRSVVAVLLFAVLAFLLPIFDEIFLAVKEPDFPTYRFFCWLSGLMGGSVFCFEEVPIQVMNTKMAGQFQMHLGWVSSLDWFSLFHMFSGKFGDSFSPDCVKMRRKVAEESYSLPLYYSFLGFVWLLYHQSIEHPVSRNVSIECRNSEYDRYE